MTLKTAIYNVLEPSLTAIEAFVSHQQGVPTGSNHVIQGLKDTSLLIAGNGWNHSGRTDRRTLSLTIDFEV